MLITLVRQGESSCNISIYEASISIYEASIGIYEASISIYEASISIYGASISIYEASISIYEASITIYEAYISCQSVLGCSGMRSVHAKAVEALAFNMQVNRKLKVGRPVPYVKRKVLMSKRMSENRIKKLKNPCPGKSTLERLPLSTSFVSHTMMTYELDPHSAF